MMRAFLSFIKEYFRGLGAEYREMFICRGDPRSSRVKDRGAVWIGGVETYITNYMRSTRELRGWNIYMGIGYWNEHGLLEPQADKMLYDRLSFDFDNEESPQVAIVEALGFANLIYKKYGASPIVFETGFKGAHVVIPLSKPVNWESYQLLWEHFYGLIPVATRRMVDKNMLQWNRVDRVPLTYNVKEEGAKYCRIIYPEEYTWEDFNWRELSPLDPSGVIVIKVAVPDAVKPSIIHKQEKGWIWEVVRSGLPDGRKRFMFYVLIPYLAVVRGMNEENVLAMCNEFIENSCRNHDKCSKIYDSWIRGAIEWVREKSFRGFGLEKLKEKDPELYNLIEKALALGGAEDAVWG